MHIKRHAYHYFAIVNDGEMVEVENEAGIGFINNHMVHSLPEPEECTGQFTSQFEEKIEKLKKAAAKKANWKKFAKSAVADKLDASKYFYQSDVLIDALAAGLEANSTTVKNALEKYMAANGGVKMAPTDAYGKTQVTDLQDWLYGTPDTSVFILVEVRW